MPGPTAARISPVIVGRRSRATRIRLAFLTSGHAAITGDRGILQVPYDRGAT
ncbi:hypothetical protein [Streptomyces sp. AcE210]|uniref:hypothetical protein n=1 Tax=Streptomyces sp. AcE210 TaxID=2292703 RepID=UPI001404DC32|nr:hypothetical protein [Streptomyces sp. AcE210]